MSLFKPDAELDERTCQLICPIAAAMVGVCLTGIGILQLVVSFGRHATLADDMLAFDAMLFLVAVLTSYFALRLSSTHRQHRLEQVADAAFISGMVLMTAVCFTITYALTFKF